MRGKENLNRYAALAGVLCFLTGLTGCVNPSEELKERKAVIDDYAEIILLQDKDSAGFDVALAAVDRYLKESAPEQKTAALGILADTAAQMESDSDACASYEAEESFAEILENQGISLAEYEMNADTRYHSLQGFLQELAFLEELLFYADEGEAFRTDLEQAYGFIAEEQRLTRGYCYTGINYWFAGWGEEETEYLKEQVLDRLQSFSAEDAVWEDSRDAVEARMNTYLDGLEEINDAWAASLGESWEELNRMKEQIGENQSE